MAAPFFDVALAFSPSSPSPVTTWTSAWQPRLRTTGSSFYPEGVRSAPLCARRLTLSKKSKLIGDFRLTSCSPEGLENDQLKSTSSHSSISCFVLAPIIFPDYIILFCLEFQVQVLKHRFYGLKSKPIFNGAHAAALY